MTLQISVPRNSAQAGDTSTPTTTGTSNTHSLLTQLLHRFLSFKEICVCTYQQAHVVTLTALRVGWPAVAGLSHAASRFRSSPSLFVFFLCVCCLRCVLLFVCACNPIIGGCGCIVLPLEHCQLLTSLIAVYIFLFFFLKVQSIFTPQSISDWVILIEINQLCSLLSDLIEIINKLIILLHKQQSFIKLLLLQFIHNF